MPSTAQRSKPAKPKRKKASKKVSKRKQEAPKRKQKPMRKVVAPVVEETPRLVSYYLEGWRFGYREGVRGDAVVIQPIGPQHAPPPRTIRVPADDVREIRKEST